MSALLFCLFSHCQRHLDLCALCVCERHADVPLTPPQPCSTRCAIPCVDKLPYLLFIRILAQKSTRQTEAQATVRLRCRSECCSGRIAHREKEGNNQNTHARPRQRSREWARGQERQRGGVSREDGVKVCHSGEFHYICGIHCIRKLTLSSCRAFNASFSLFSHVSCERAYRIFVEYILNCSFGLVLWLAGGAGGAVSVDVLFTLENIALARCVCVCIPSPRTSYGCWCWSCRCCELWPHRLRPKVNLPESRANARARARSRIIVSTFVHGFM